MMFAKILSIMLSVALILVIVVNLKSIWTVFLASVGCMILNGPRKATEDAWIKSLLEIRFVRMKTTMGNVVLMAMIAATHIVTFPTARNVDVNFPTDLKTAPILKK